MQEASSRRQEAGPAWAKKRLGQNGQKKRFLLVLVLVHVHVLALALVLVLVLRTGAGCI